MSIWCSQDPIGYDEDTNETRRGEVRSFAHGWGNHYPTTDGQVEQPASIELAWLPPRCVPGWENEPLDESDATGPWLRLFVNSRVTTLEGLPTKWRGAAAVVLDESAARSLARDLLEWADWPKVYPASAP